MSTQEHEQPQDIEHVFVTDDPRKWPTKRKTFTLAIISMASLILTLGIYIYNPAINVIKRELYATNQEISLSLAIFSIVQGATPFFWSAASEILGRKPIYIASISLYILGCTVAGFARNIGVLIAMRVVQGLGGSAVLSIGAATLADVYESQERGKIVGIYFVAPLLGPSMGPLIGGVATQLFSWRATFFCLVIFASLSLATFIFFKDTFRRERSLFYQSALPRATRERQIKPRSMGEAGETNRGENFDRFNPIVEGPECPTSDLKAQSGQHQPEPIRTDIRLSLRTINPFGPIGSILRRRNNVAVLFTSGLIYGFTYSITYTVVRTFAAAPYLYGSLNIGLILLSMGVGSMIGSILGGRWSDYALTRLKDINGGRIISEERLHSTKPMILVLPLSVVGYGWMAEKVHIAGICIVLFMNGFSSTWIYSSILAYIVDSNVGRSSTAVATNSFWRGMTSFVAAELAVPLQDSLGDGWLYTLWAGLMVIALFLILLTIEKGARWRELAEERESQEREDSVEM